ncbi:MAG: hypothetical protein ACFCUP_04810 [Actinomycetales bacterium]
MIEHVQETIDGIVFGNGWLALGGLALLVAFTVLIRLLPGIRV